MHFITGLYLQMTAVLFACLIAGDTLRRAASLRTAYILAAVLAAGLGIVGYFRLVPGSELLIENDRARGTFKDPNVFGPFLILPLLFLVQGILYRGFRLLYVAGIGVILIGLFLSFSRGAWAHFVISAVLMMALMFVTAPTVRFRARILGFAVASAIGVAGLVAVLLSFDAVSEMFTVRASLVQAYDTGQSGRFGRQAAGFEAILDHPNGVGPEQFGKRELFGQAPHNVYINAFMTSGWAGGLAYIAIVVITLVVGFRTLLVATPWQPYLIAGYATFVGLVGEGIVIDTDHWRHFYLLLGLVWGLMIATEKSRRSAPRMS
jgi:O-antigen ligase